MKLRYGKICTVLVGRSRDEILLAFKMLTGRRQVHHERHGSDYCQRVTCIIPLSQGVTASGYSRYNALSVCAAHFA